MMNEFVEYQSYADLGRYLNPADFAKWHAATSKNIVLFLVLPILLGNIALIALFWNRPPSVPKWTLWVALACALTAWASTIAFQVPIEQQFDQGGCGKRTGFGRWLSSWE